jgi:hypothetical protein
VVSATNPRYFSIGSAESETRGIYLTGSHIWNNLHDGMGPGPTCAHRPEVFDYEGYLASLNLYGHNFIRLWRWEQFRSQAAGAAFHLCMTPQPWLRCGPGSASDGKPRFDLSKFDPAFFERLRHRVRAAGERGIYVGVMLFDGWALHLSPAPHHVEGHPFHELNNVNGVAIRSIRDYQVLPLDERVRAFQRDYIHKVVDAIHDLPNVLYEVANESSGGGSVDAGFAAALGQSGMPDWGDSTSWQYWVIETVKRHEQEMGYASHPIGMTMQFPVAVQTKVNEPLFKGPADWVSPGFDDEIFVGGRYPMQPGSPPSRWLADPPPADGTKVVISDTDHYAPGKGDALWAWKSFLRGHHPILMDFGMISGPRKGPVLPGAPPYELFEDARRAMGDTRRLADRVNLLKMMPRGDLASTGYALASPGQEYVVLQPLGSGDAFVVDLVRGSYSIEWFDVTHRDTRAGRSIAVARDTRVSLVAPFPVAGPSVLYLRRTDE